MIRIVKSYILSLLLVFSGIACCPARPLPKAWVRDSLPALTERCRQLLSRAYMAEKLIGETRSLPGWEGFNVRLYEYRTGRDVRTGAPKTGRVYLLNPEPERLARWIATTCLEVKGSLGFEYTDRLLRWIRGQSGAQFPVRGVVYEAMERPGATTVRVQGRRDGVRGRQRPLPGRRALHPRTVGVLPDPDRCRPETPHGPLRPHLQHDARTVQSRRRPRRSGRQRLRPPAAWLDTVRRLYRRAMKSDRNELMIAWAKANL